MITSLNITVLMTTPLKTDANSSTWYPYWVIMKLKGKKVEIRVRMSLDQVTVNLDLFIMGLNRSRMGYNGFKQVQDGFTGLWVGLDRVKDELKSGLYGGCKQV